jgi:DNA-binding transcriptional LysR family regulator
MSLAEHSIREKRLVALFGAARSTGRGFHAIYAERARERPEAVQFVEWLKSEIAAEAREAS